VHGAIEDEYIKERGLARQIEELRRNVLFERKMNNRVPSFLLRLPSV
jgi:hypothetical protein